MQLRCCMKVKCELDPGAITGSDRIELHASLFGWLQALVIMGHSTGCQDAVRYAARYGRSAEAAPVLGYILQAPVCFHTPFLPAPGWGMAQVGWNCMAGVWWGCKDRAEA